MMSGNTARLEHKQIWTGFDFGCYTSCFLLYLMAGSGWIVSGKSLFVKEVKLICVWNVTSMKAG